MTDRLRTVSEDDLARLKAAREAAEEYYNETLPMLDRTLLRSVPDIPHPPPPPDEAQVTPLNERWRILDAKPAFPTGWRGRLAAFVWGLIEPALTAQQAFNSAAVDHMNRNIVSQREVVKSISTTIVLLQQQFERLVHFDMWLMTGLQRLTPAIDAKDREFAALARRITEDTQEEIDRLDRIARGLAAGISGVSDEMLKRFESLLARDQRYTGRMDDLRTSIAVAQQQIAALRRQFDALPRAAAAAGHTPQTDAVPGVSTDAAGAPATGSPRGIESVSDAAASAPPWYVGFEDLFRGAQDVIRARQRAYLPLFEGASDVLDIGCGRGEFLDLLTTQGIRARGIDLNREMVEVCRTRGLDVIESDALTYLQAQADASLGGLIALQVVEHLDPPYLLHVLDQAHRTLRPGAPLVLETINVACWLAFFESYLRDLTHAKPLHPDTLKYLVTASGFVDVEVRFAEPIDPANRLQPVPRAVRQQAGADVAALADTFDGNMQRLNQLLFTDMDYAVIARRP